MKIKHAAWLVAAVLSAPVLAQTQVQSASGIGVTSSTGVGVTPGAPAMVVVPGTPNTVPRAHIPGAVMAQADSRTTVNGNQKTTVTTYWANVPANVRGDASFQRWQSLK
ncbi:MAG: hypothetical protein JWP65_1008 [Ramlibacter sp.]|jgi:hypothetical protein|uniref:hypothetical protein n=1 Tax=Ramlibacter sp. TaxID=1917967 RepID=UPI00261B249D|nr:hypothetical protein [Ramlibacter sp.]MDB5750587.1 hypothetical protein [Ramlibacter sp.]